MTQEELDRELLQTIHTSSAAKVKELLKAGADVQAKNIYGRTALMKAAYNGRTDIAELLLEHNADVNMKDKYGVTSLIRAARRGYTITVQLLLEHNADVNAEDQFRETALMKSCFNGDMDTAHLLLDYGADINIRNINRQTAFDILRINHPRKHSKLIADIAVKQLKEEDSARAAVTGYEFDI